MNNHKGQVLVVFILLLPVILLLFGLIVDTGLLYIEKRHIDNSIKEAIKYRFESELNENQLYEVIDKLLTSNVKDIKSKQVNISNNYIEITINKEITSAFSLLFSREMYKINSTYIGYINNNKLVITKE